MLNLFHDGSAWLAALALVGTLAMVRLSSICRIRRLPCAGCQRVHRLQHGGGRLPGAGHALKRNEHIPVTLVLGRLKGRAQHLLELWALSAAVLLAGLFALYSVRLVWVSHAFNDISTSNDATPLWIPQLAMANRHHGAVDRLHRRVDAGAARPGPPTLYGWAKTCSAASRRG